MNESGSVWNELWISATEFRSKKKYYMNMALFRPIVFTKYGKPTGVLVGTELYNKMKKENKNG